MKIVFIGLTVSSSWGNGHATTYRGLLRSLKKQDQQVTFLEHDKPWYSQNRDFAFSEDYELIFYPSVAELKDKHRNLISTADMVVVGSYVPEGVQVSKWVQDTARGVTAFYDIDTPVTLEKLDKGDEEYINKQTLTGFDLYLSFSGGEVLDLLESKYKAKKARALYCSVDPDLYYPMKKEKKWNMGYLGTYSDDRQPLLNELLIEPAKKLKNEVFVVAGPNYPDAINWSSNINRIDHLAPDKHSEFYNQQHFTLNITRQAMVKLGYSPSVRLFEAAACGVPIISDYWRGLTDLFKEGEEILIARNTDEMMDIIKMSSSGKLEEIGSAARKKILGSHTSEHRAKELMTYYQEVVN